MGIKHGSFKAQGTENETYITIGSKHKIWIESKLEDLLLLGIEAFNEIHCNNSH